MRIIGSKILNLIFCLLLIVLANLNANSQQCLCIYNNSDQTQILISQHADACADCGHETACCIQQKELASVTSFLDFSFDDERLLTQSNYCLNNFYRAAPDVSVLCVGNRAPPWKLSHLPIAAQVRLLI